MQYMHKARKAMTVFVWSDDKISIVLGLPAPEGKFECSELKFQFSNFSKKNLARMPLSKFKNSIFKSWVSRFGGLSWSIWTSVLGIETLNHGTQSNWHSSPCLSCNFWTNEDKIEFVSLRYLVSLIKFEAQSTVKKEVAAVFNEHKFCKFFKAWSI